LVIAEYRKGLEVKKKITEEELKMDLGWCMAKKYIISKNMFEIPRLCPTILGSSPELIRVPMDWPQSDSVVVAGWYTMDKESQRKRLESGDAMYGAGAGPELVKFLEAGAAPVYIGWGSMSCVSQQHMTCLAVRALKKAGKRGILLGGWAKLSLDAIKGVPDADDLLHFCEGNVLVMKTAPHVWLFPQCACVVHHGGSGTTAAGVMAGVPTIITPVFLDQFDYADAVNREGIGRGLRSLTKVTPEEIAVAITKCCTDEGVITAARAMGEATSKRDGVAIAVKTITSFYHEKVATGVFAKDYEQELQAAKPQPRLGLFACCLGKKAEVPDERDAGPGGK
jgi:UDP:flavonoid glycosyltransferase YjiC (YdhE family)